MSGLAIGGGTSKNDGVVAMPEAHDSGSANTYIRSIINFNSL